jgi:ribonucleoside-diphosphate reductase alpha chain
METIYWLNEDSRTYLQRGYLLPGETAENRIRDIAVFAENILQIQGFANKFEDYLKRGFYSLSSPIWSNFGRKRGLPISCFGSYVNDDINDILFKIGEVGSMSKSGGGTSGYFGKVRSRGSKISSGGESTGVHHQLTVFNAITNYISQGNVRRGSFAAYLPIDHGDFDEFINIRSDGDSIQDLSIGVCITNEWMEDMIAGNTEKRQRWGKVIKKRFESGYPYIFFTDNANDQAPKVYKDKGLKITHSNLCSEIMLANGVDESFVCDLSSLNLEKWDEWKDTDAIEVLTFFLDAVMTDFINKTEGDLFLSHARKFAINQRALGIGVLGWHTYLQSKMIAFESLQAKSLNTQIWKNIRTKADNASQKLSEIFGEPELLKGYGRRNTTTLAIAPTTSSSFILGQVSPSIEPLNSNYFVKDLAKGKFTFRNPHLVKLLASKDKNSEDIWRSILVKGGSVQHLEFLTEDEKNVFKTFGEISQKEIIIQAAARQKYIDQGQSLNIMIPPDTKPKDVSELTIFAWREGIKALYYQRSANPAQELARNILNCQSCQS